MYVLCECVVFCVTSGFGLGPPCGNIDLGQGVRSDKRGGGLDLKPQIRFVCVWGLDLDLDF